MPSINIVGSSPSTGNDYEPEHNVSNGEGMESEQIQTSHVCTITTKEQTIYKFDSNGQITSMEDANGR